MRKKILSFLLAFSLITVYLSLFTPQGLAENAAEQESTFGFSNVQQSGGSITKTDREITLEGSGQQALFNYFYGNKITDTNGFSALLSIDSVAKTNLYGAHDTYFGIQFGAVQSNSLVFNNSAPGMIIVLKPRSVQNSFEASILLNNGTGISGISIGNGILTLADKNAFSVKLLKDNAGNWKLFLNGSDTSTDLSAVQNLLNNGFYFGVKAYENLANYASEQSVSLTVRELSGKALGNLSAVSSSNIIKSGRKNVDSGSAAKICSGGIMLSGQASAETVYAFRYALCDPVKDLNGFSSCFSLDSIDGYHGQDGVSSFIDFALTTFNATASIALPSGYVNSDRMDVWDYYNSPVSTARGIQLRFRKTADNTLLTQVFMIGVDGQFNIPNDVLTSISANFDGKNITVTSVKSGVNWVLLVNGINILNETDTAKLSEWNAVLDSVSIYGATPVFAAGYENMGSLAVSGNVSLTVKSINSRPIGKSTTYQSSVDPTPGANGYEQDMGICQTLADFEYGLDKTYDSVNCRSSYYWQSLMPSYNYSYTVPSGFSGEISATVGMEDNSNDWYVFPDTSGQTAGYSDVFYVFNLPGEQNYRDFRGYQVLKLLYQGDNPNNNKVNLTAAFYSAGTNLWYNLGKAETKAGQKTVLSFDFTDIPANALADISKLRLRTCADTISCVNGNGYQKNVLFSIAVYGRTAPEATTVVDDIYVKSETLGNMMLGRYGSYSASGFYDSSDQKWKLWYGGGIPEGSSGDNIYYMETDDPQGAWSKPVRLIINMTIPFVPQGTKRHETVLLALSFVLLYNKFEMQIYYRARGGECATLSADRINMCANHHFKHK